MEKEKIILTRDDFMEATCHALDNEAVSDLIKKEPMLTLFLAMYCASLDMILFPEENNKNPKEEFSELRHYYINEEHYYVMSDNKERKYRVLVYSDQNKFIEKSKAFDTETHCFIWILDYLSMYHGN